MKFKTIINMVCRKVKFRNEKHTLEYIEKLQRTSIRQYVPVRAYLCDKCMNWHVTARATYGTEQFTEEIKRLNFIIRGLKIENESLKSKVKKLKDSITFIAQ